jgi:RNA recognition motif-containing protein
MCITVRKNRRQVLLNIIICPYFRAQKDLMNVFVAGLPYDMDDLELRAIFEDYGQVAAATIVIDRTTGHSRGFGFVEFVNEADAQAAIQALDRATLEGRTMTVKVAEARQQRRPKTHAR